jgi:hypothetical protein
MQAASFRFGTSMWQVTWMGGDCFHDRLDSFFQLGQMSTVTVVR